MNRVRETACVVMAKWPVPGHVKTRLAAALGDAAAADLARAMLLDTMDRVHASSLRPFLALDTGSGPMPGEVAGVRPEPQRGAGLGDRVAAAVAARWEEGLAGVVVLGTDSPDFPDARLEQAAAALERAPSVLGPTADGGLYLLAFRRVSDSSTERLEEALRKPEWGSASVFQQTRAALARPLGPPHILPGWYDIDLPEDLERLAREGEDQASPRHRPARVDAWVRAYRAGRML